MTTITNYLTRVLREYIYLMTTLPVAIALFFLVQIGFTPMFLPVSVLLALGLLSVMPWVAKFELQRTNGILKTDFQIVDNWFGKPFFSWDGVKERVTSLRSWMAIGYIFVAFGISFALVLFAGVALLGAFLVLLSFGIFSDFVLRQRFEFYVFDSEFVTSGDIEKISVGLVGLDPIKVQVTEFFGMASSQEPVVTVDTNQFFSQTFLLIAGVVLLFAGKALFMSLARPLPKLAEGFLSGTFLPRFEVLLRQVSRELKVTEREIREAMDKKSLQPELSMLSKRELEILAQMAQGKSNAGIARSLYITEGSVEKHISNIFSKLNLKAEEDSHRRVLAVLAYLEISPKNI
jgi:DNA-binding CsgD family transcriptional regulator